MQFSSVKSQFTRRSFVRAIGITAGTTTLGAPFCKNLAALIGPSENPALRERLADDILRPQYHLLPPANWINDPNGPIYWNGEYHMFYQYSPSIVHFGNVHWGHAVSPDMLHWRHLPVALAPTPGGPDWDGCYSGSVIINQGTPTLLYTGVTPEVQCIATSTDGMLTWKKDPKPIIAAPPPGLKVTEWRDPCSPWREGDWWYMGIGSGFPGHGGVLLLYRSRNLRGWEYLHTLAEGWNGTERTDPVNSGDAWQCPDFFAIGDKHVLMFSCGPVARTYWSVGTYSDLRFHVEKRGVLDYGICYAAKSMPDSEGNRIVWSWVRETRPVQEQEAAGWSGCISLPRKLSIGKDGGLCIQPIPALKNLYEDTQTVTLRDGKEHSGKLAAMRIHDLCGSLHVTQRHGTPAGFEANLVEEGSSDVPFATLQYDPAKTDRELTVNGTSAPLHLGEEMPAISAYVDGSILEVYANDRVCITSRIYTKPRRPLRVTTTGISGEDHPALQLILTAMRPVSKDRLTS
jgi:beta-fructofuranosidase